MLSLKGNYGEDNTI